jgi:hypothetical protein
MRRRSEHSSQIVISEGLPHILQTWCASSGWGSDRRWTIFMPCLLSSLSTRSIEAATLLRTGNSPLSALELASGTIRAQTRKADELARNAHSLLASTQKPRPTAISLWVRWSNTTYSPWDSVVSSLMRSSHTQGRSPAQICGNFPRVLSSGFQMENAWMPPALHCVGKQTEGGRKWKT